MGNFLVPQAFTWQIQLILLKMLGFGEKKCDTKFREKKIHHKLAACSLFITTIFNLSYIFPKDSFGGQFACMRI